MKNPTVQKFIFYALLIVFGIVAWHVIHHIDKAVTTPSSAYIR